MSTEVSATRRRGKEGLPANGSSEDLLDGLKREENKNQEDQELQPSEDKRESYSDSAPAEQPSMLASLNPRWRNWWIRGMFTLVMIGGFSIIVYLGPFALILLV